jgi:septum formation protein
LKVPPAVSSLPPFPSDFRLILASQSPRRHSFLRDLGIPFTVVSSRAEELESGTDAVALAEENAAVKARAASLPSDLEPGSFVLATDTVVTLAHQVMGKPSSPEEAKGMLVALSGKTHEVVSGVALLRTSQAGSAASGQLRVSSAATGVTFLPLREAEIDAYVASGEWRGKAGAYAVQGLAALFICDIQGEYTNVVGLPLCLLSRMFRELSFDLLTRKWL